MTFVTGNFDRHLVNLFRRNKPRCESLKKMPVDEDASRFNLLKAQFGSEDDAGKLTLEEFAAMPDKRAETLVDRIRSSNIVGEISVIRTRAKKASQASRQAGGRKL